MTGSLAPVLIFAGHETWLGLAGVLLAELFGATGAGIIPWWRRNSSSALERFGLTFLAGLAVTGLSLFGLALAGLLYPVTVALLMAGTACSSLVAGHRPSLAWNALRELMELGRLPCMLLAVAAAPFAFLLAIPFLNIDSAVYHLGAPAQFLRAHRILSEHVPFPYLLPLPVEMTYTIPLALGDYRLASVIAVLALAAAAAVFLGRKRGGTAWISPLLLLSCAGTLSLTVGGKNDVAAASFLVAGALLWETGFHGLGAALMGFGAAAKPVYGPFLVAWLLVVPPPRGRLVRVLSGLAIPFMPWFARSWLATGNPVYPFASTILPTLGWGTENNRAFAAYATTLILPPTAGWTAMAGYWLDYLRAESLPVILLLPALLLNRRSARTAAACLLGSALILETARVPRYCLPSVMILSLLAAREAGGLVPSIPRPVLAALLAGFALARIGLDPGLRRPGWRGSLMPFRDGMAQEFTTQGDACRLLADLGARRYINVASKVTYPIPGRALHDGTMGETPLLWKIAKESSTPERVAVKIRQLGATHLLYNHISAEWNMIRYNDAFAWNRRMLSVYKAWFKSYAVPAGNPTACDFIHGGFYAFRLRVAPARRPAESAFYLPGTETIYRDSIRARDAGRFADSLAVFRQLAIENPDIVTYRAELGFDCAMTGRWADAYRLLKPVVSTGIRHVRAPVYGLAALRAGHVEEARVFLKDCLTIYLFEPTMIRLGLAEACLASARQDAYFGRIAAARVALAEAESALVFDPAPDEKDAPETRAGIRQRIGEIRKKYGLSR